MFELKLTLEAATPIFMYGMKQEAELRPSEFKGLMRFWWRAIKAYESNKLSKLREEEIQIFGGRGERKILKSVIDIKIENLNIKKGTNLKYDKKLKWIFKREAKTIKGEHEGIGYLLYSLIKKNYIDVGSKFKIKLKSFDKNAFENATSAIWTAIYFGGFGSRSRRGGGNLKVLDVKSTDNVIDFELNVNNNTEIYKWLSTNLKKAKEIVESDNTTCTEYSSLREDGFIISKKDYENWIDALNWIGRFYKNFRYAHRHKLLEIVAFGLPIQNHKMHPNRRASPIIFKVLKNSNGKYFWMAVRLFGKFLPSDRIKFNYKEKTVSYELLNYFWDSLKDHGVWEGNK